MTATEVTSRRPPAFGSDARRTAFALLASGLGVLPLAELFIDAHWLWDVWLAMLVVIVPVMLLRVWLRARAWQTWLGLALLIPWATARFVPHHAFLGCLPTHATWHDVDLLMNQVQETTSNGVAPVHAGPAIEFLLALIAGGLAAFIDLIAVVGRRAALAGVPLLVVYTVSGAVPRHPVSWQLFVAAGAAFLLLLSLDASDSVRAWGRLIPRHGESRAKAALGVSGPRIAVLAIGVAVLLPLIAPSRTSNLIADAFHNGKGNGAGPGTGLGGNGGTALNPFAVLKGDLQRSKPVNLFTVTVDPASGATPYYLRANVLVDYTDRGWSAGAHDATDNINATAFDTVPPSSGGLDTVAFTARIKVSGLNDNAPVFARPISVGGLDDKSTWSRADQLLLGPRVHHNQEIVELINQPAPTIEQLSAAAAADPQEAARWLHVPASMPTFVRDLVEQLTASKSTPYAKARALSDYFTDTANGFTYRLETKAGDSGSDLVDFLTNKTGYCQQYAAAMGIMLRMAGVPARVVLGYTHSEPDTNGVFTVTTTNAHAWVEGYFTGLGWIPFDPTPIAGAAGGATTNLAWAPHQDFGASTSTNTAPAGPSRPTAEPTGGTTGTTSNGDRSSGSGFTFTWPLLVTLIAVVVLLAVASVPAVVRWRRRRSRLRAARHGDPDPLWAELSDTAVDLGYVWSPARSPRQVVGWLGSEVRNDPGSLQTLATAVEAARYAPVRPMGQGAELLADLRTVEAQLRQRRSTSTRVRSRLLPASLAWRLRLPLPGRRQR